MWRAADFNTTGRYVINYSQCPGKYQFITFAESYDLIHWTRPAYVTKKKEDRIRCRHLCIWPILRRSFCLYLAGLVQAVLRPMAHCITVPFWAMHARSVTMPPHRSMHTDERATMIRRYRCRGGVIGLSWFALI